MGEGGGMNILVVEDDFSSQQLLKKFLSPIGKVIIAEDGRKAVDFFRDYLVTQDKIDLVCLDIMLPELSGQDVLKEIRKLEETNGILGLDGVKVIMLTAMHDAENIIKAFRSQCESYITKPLVKEKLFFEMQNLGLLNQTS